MWKAFQPHGVIKDAYVAKKRDVRGNFFGFVRYAGVENVEAVLRSMNTVRIFEAKLTVTIAKFDKDHKMFPNNVEPLFHQQQLNNNNPKPTMRWQPVNVVPGVSYSDALVGQNRRKQVTVEEAIDLYPKHCMGRAVVGELVDPKAASFLRAMLNRGGHEDAAISYVGGLHFLVVFKDRDEARRFTENVDLWREFFSKVDLWEGQEASLPRLVCLKMVGVPLKLMDCSVYDKIGECFGKLVKRSDFSWTTTDVSYGRCYVLTGQKKLIQEEIDLLWKGSRFQVGVAEVEDGWFTSIVSALSSPVPASPVISAESVNGVDDQLEEGELRENQDDQLTGEDQNGVAGSSEDEPAPVGGLHGVLQESLHGESLQPPSGKEDTRAADVNNATKGHVRGPTCESIDLNKVGQSFSVGPNSGMDMDPPMRSRKRSRACRSPVSKAQDEGEVSSRLFPVEDPCPSIVFQPLNVIPQRQVSQDGFQWQFPTAPTHSPVAEAYGGAGMVDGDSANPDLSRPTSAVHVSEAEHTVRVGTRVGFQLSGFEEDVNVLINGEGDLTVPQ
ncbi:putative RNA recognition motif domain, nucleotide-binding alpha-beta plait domain superfamily [Helianthus annuus]|nr:putative RNA recognition motif domain, nucleotide-binding alpha-beta plait domain superfamily [Helianthus annuus]